MTGDRVLLIAIVYAVLMFGSRLIIFRALSRGTLSKRRAALAAAAISAGLLFAVILFAGIYEALGLIWFVVIAVHFVWMYGWIALLTSPSTG